ncbi:MAG: S41 family peptidase [Ignavibacteriae bacterium]|nr:S41 family peptidase [Ignavibacteriota bacterium]
MFRKRFSLASVFVLLFFGVFLGAQIQAISEDNIYEQLNKFKDVLSFTQKYYVDEVSTSRLVEKAVEGLLKDLDPHSVYIDPKSLVKVQEDFKGSFEGIGIEFNILHDTITVVSPIFGGPSEKVGLLAGDKIVQIDGQSSVKVTNDDVQKKLRGEKGSKVVVDIVRAGVKDVLQFTITRDKIPLYSVDTYFVLEDGTGYMVINRFASNTYQEFINGLRDMRTKGMEKLILDLRGNPGGYLEQSFRMANEFLARGEKIVYTKGRSPQFDENYNANGAGEFQDLPLIVLVTRASASASEIVAGAVQDHDRGLIVGETTFGKGLVQRQFDLPDGSAFRLTTARYYTPSGRIIQRPYDGKSDEEYYKTAGDKSEAEGDNIEHHEDKADTSRPKYKTDAGRTVLGGGGITPDYIVKVDNLTEYAAKMRARLFEFISGYMDKNGPAFRQKYGKDQAQRFTNEFSVDDELLASFVSFGESKNIPLVKEQYQKDLDYIKALIKAQIARNLFGNEGFFRALLQADPQFRKARTLFPEAKKIAGLK